MTSTPAEDAFRAYIHEVRADALHEGKQTGIRMGKRMAYDELISDPTAQACLDAIMGHMGEPADGEEMEWWEEVLVPVTKGTVHTIITAAAAAIREH